MPACDGGRARCRSLKAGIGSNIVNVTEFLRLLMILELYPELSYFLSYMFIAVTVTEVPRFPI